MNEGLGLDGSCATIEPSGRDRAPGVCMRLSLVVDERKSVSGRAVPCRSAPWDGEIPAFAGMTIMRGSPFAGTTVRGPRPGLVWVRERPAPYGENALAVLWQRAHTLPDGLLTEDGRRFRVVYPGRPSGRAGPDFRDSVLEAEDGRLVTGDVELHVEAPGWRSHGHHADPGYNGVVLHVVLRAGGAVSSRQQSRASAPVASLEPVVDRLRRAGDGARPSAFPWESMSPGAIEKVLDAAGDRRFLARSRGFAREIEAGDADQVVYAALFEALGYAANRKPFRRLAEVVPFATVATLRGEPGGTRLAAVRALLLTASGLVSRDGAPDAGLVRRLPRTGRLAPDAWRLLRVRPSNHPARRVEGAARLVDRFLDAGPAAWVTSAADAGKPAALVRALSDPPFVGAGRARDMAVNVALPFAHALAGASRDGDAAARRLEAYRAFPGLADNDITREMKRLLADRGLPVSARGARRHQGLAHLYNVTTLPGMARTEWPAMARAAGEA